jgi:hypothetical protein
VADDTAPLFCDRCTKTLEPGRGDFYVVRIDAVADPSGPVITEDELAVDARREIEQLIARMRGMTEQELKDQVYRRVVIHLCVPCYQRWIENPTGT